MNPTPLSCSACKARRSNVLCRACHATGNSAEASAAAGHSNAVQEGRTIEDVLTAHRICGAADCDAHISALEGGRVVDAVACHADVVAELPQGLHDEELVVGEHLQRTDASEPPDVARYD